MKNRMISKLPCSWAKWNAILPSLLVVVGSTWHSCTKQRNMDKSSFIIAWCNSAKTKLHFLASSTWQSCRIYLATLKWPLRIAMCKAVLPVDVSTVVFARQSSTKYRNMSRRQLLLATCIALHEHISRDSTSAPCATHCFIALRLPNVVACKKLLFNFCRSFRDKLRMHFLSNVDPLRFLGSSLTMFSERLLSIYLYNCSYATNVWIYTIYRSQSKLGIWDAGCRYWVVWECYHRTGTYTDGSFLVPLDRTTKLLMHVPSDRYHTTKVFCTLLYILPVLCKIARYLR